MTTLPKVDVARPTTLAEAQQVMLDAGRNRALLIRGGGTKLDWGAPAERCELVVETSGLNQVLAHDPADATATVQAGMSLADLQAQLHTSGQWLAIDPPHEGATVGGVFAANATGPRRLRYGSMRDLVIGMTVVTADGAVARSGGNVIKNVAGYDLAKLLCGSLGTLGLVAALVVRLHPIPASTTTVTAPADATTATDIALSILASPLAVSAIDWSEGLLAVRIDGRESGVEQQIGDLRSLLARHVTEHDALKDDDAAALWARLAQAHAGSAGETVLAAAVLPSLFGQAAEDFEQVCAEAQIEGTVAGHVGNGLLSGRVRDGQVERHAAVVQAWRRRVEDLGGHVVVRRRHEQLTDPAVIWGDEPSGIVLMRAVKQHLDRDRRCAPGRFTGGI